jgi:hypothetical protein
VACRPTLPQVRLVCRLANANSIPKAHPWLEGALGSKVQTCVASDRGVYTAVAQRAKMEVPVKMKPVVQSPTAGNSWEGGSDVPG